MTVPFAVQHARWDVMWVTSKRGKKQIIVKEFEDDLASALDLYVKLQGTGRKLVTLRSCNVGFPPPEKYELKMNAYNSKGWWWCPYCMKLRMFEKRDGFWDKSTWYGIPHLACPMCDVMHNNGHVVRYNPIAMTLLSRKRSKGRSKKRGNARKSRRR